MNSMRAWGLALVLMFGGVSAGAADAAGRSPAKPLTFDIPAQQLKDALSAFGRQSGLFIAFYDESVAHMKSAPLTGSFTPEAALTQLLANSGLRFEFVDDKTVSIRAAKGGGASTLNPADQMRLAAENETRKGAPGSASEDAGNQVTVESSRERSAPFANGNLDLTRTEDDVLPYTVFTADEIRRSGAADLSTFLRDRLPQNINADVSDQTDTMGIQMRNDKVDLRGWGAAETVFLLNGRRMSPEYQPFSADKDNASPNLRGIALASIERIEILSSAGSAIYGSGATGGVINIITRRDYKGGQLSVNYETPDDVLRPQRSVNLTFGAPLKWGMNLRTVASYSDSEPMRVGDRSEVTVERYRTLAWERDRARLIEPVDDSPFFTSTLPFLGATPNIRASDAGESNLFAGLAGVAASNFTTVPAGYTSRNLAAFQPGVYNLGLADASGGSEPVAKGAQIGSEGSNVSFGLGLNKDFGKRWRWSLDHRYSQNDSERLPSTAFNFTADAFNYAVISPLLLPATGTMMSFPEVPALAPANPFGTDVQVNLDDPAMNLPELGQRLRNVTWEASSTLQGEIGAWRGYFDLAYTQNEIAIHNSAFIEPLQGWNDAFLINAYNPFVDPRVAAYAAPAFYRNYIRADFGFVNKTETWRSALKASGPVFRLPAGEVQLTAGLEWANTDRKRPVVGVATVDSSTGRQRDPSFGAVSSSTDLLASALLPYVFDSYAGYAEANIPLLSPKQGVALARRLEIFSSGRVDRTVRTSTRSATDGREVEYTDTARISAYGLRYEPVEGMTLRVSRSSGFRPPGMSEVTPSAPPTRAPSPSTVKDPRRNNESRAISAAMYINGGNPDLTPESTESTNAGLILTPRWAHGLRLSLDYLESIRDNAIFSVSPQEAVLLETEFPGRIQRGTPDASGVGPITFIDARLLNLRQIASRSLDISLQQTIENVGRGAVVFDLAATKNLSFKVQKTNTGSAVEMVRNNTESSFASRQIKWNGNAQARWEGEQWGFGWNVRYYDYLLVSRPVATPNLYTVLQGGDRAPRAFSHDLNFSYRAPTLQNPQGAQWWLSGTALNFGVKNVFDRKPRFWAQDSTFGITPYDYGLLNGRSLWLQVSRDF